MRTCLAANYSNHYHFTKYVIRLKPSNWTNYVIIDFLDVHDSQWSKLFFEKCMKWKEAEEAFRFQYYGKFWSLSLEYVIKHKPLLSFLKSHISFIWLKSSHFEMNLKYCVVRKKCTHTQWLLNQWFDSIMSHLVFRRNVWIRVEGQEWLCELLLLPR